jgi:3-deoxy-D-manno-octulosonate 8-phosphate phosphatase (KDO 8-P phosphatase)
MTLGRMRALALDVDGVLTDGGVWWGPRGQEWKRFHFADIMGVSLAVKAGLVMTLISGEDSPLIDRFAKKVGITQVAKGCKDKAAALRAFALAHHIGLGDVGFMGDDVNDLDALLLAGWSAAPADAHRAVRARVDLVTRRSGGNGAVREAIDHLMAARHAPLPAALPVPVG